VEDLTAGSSVALGCTAAIDASYCWRVPPGKKWMTP
jgi:hypothetical protein